MSILLLEIMQKKQGSGDFWLGFNDKQTEGRFVYDSNNEPLSFTYWSSSDPNNSPYFGGAENCVATYWGNKWGDFLCNSSKYFHKFSAVCVRNKPDDDLSDIENIKRFIVIKTGRLSKTGAKSFCEENDAKLFEPTNKNEYIAVRDYAKKQGSGDFWLGFNDKQTEGRFVYDSNNEPLSFTYWSSSDPNNSPYFGGAENCVATYWGNKWGDFPCNSSKYFHKFSAVCVRNKPECCDNIIVSTKLKSDVYKKITETHNGRAVYKYTEGGHCIFFG